MSDTSLPPIIRRKFLAIVDDTPECRVALRFRRAPRAARSGIVTLLYVVPPAVSSNGPGWSASCAKKRIRSRTPSP
jgi:hypothetical protein